MEIILGSGSPRRRIILEGIFGPVRVISPSVDESLLKDEPAYDYTRRITNLKMDAVLSGLSLLESGCIITSDTIVSIDNKILGKPASEDEAVSMLGMLSNNEHSVITGVSLIFKNGNDHERFYGCETTSVKFKMLSDDTILNYLGKVNYSDKAGSYAIQESGDMLVDSITGSMTNVIGFPLRLFFRMINNSGMAEFVLK